jgi:hypothetical protein
LSRALASAKPHATILLADGRYLLDRALQIKADHVTLRGASGHRDQVVLDGAGTLGEGIRITNCTGATIADLTVQNIRWNGIKLDSDTGVHRVTIHNCVLHNIWQRGVKGVGVPKAQRGSIRPADCVIRFCLFYNDRPKTYADDPSDTTENYQGNYIGGMDVMSAQGWTIADNVFARLQGRTEEGRGAIFIWQDSHQCIVERNVILDCDAGISLGSSQPGAAGENHCTAFVVRNNFLTRVPENGIFTAQTRDCRIVHNTIYDPESRRGRLIRAFAGNEGLAIVNNLVVGPPISNQTGAPLALESNVITRRLAVTDPDFGNLRLTSAATEAIDRVAPHPDGKEDIDRRARGDKPDAGAHELSPALTTPSR